MATDFISREEAISEFCDDCMDREWCKSNGESCSRIRNINAVPAANVRPVVRGKWKHDGSDWKNRFICDQCGYKWFFEAEEAHFCPNCGCAMENEK